VAIALIVMICLPISWLTLSYLLIWLFGVAAFLALDHPAISRFVLDRRVGLAGLAVLAVALAANRELGRPGYFVTGAAFAVALPWLTRAGARSTSYRRAGFLLSEMSYTLYLVHFPLLAWIYFVFVGPRQWAFGLASVGALIAILLVVMIYAAAIWWLFERNTDRVRAFVAHYLKHPEWRRNHA
jgi:peptidoglycan/LPS O-acetylase OafA/YrhL